MTESKALITVPRQTNLYSLPAVEEWKQLGEYADTLVKSRYLPAHIQSKDQMVAIILRARDLGVSVTLAINHFYVVYNKVGIEAQGQLAIIRSKVPDFKFKTLTEDNTRAVVEATRGGQTERFSFTIEEAKALGLADNPKKPQWQTQRANMLWCRAVTKMGRRMFSDVLLGMAATPDDLEIEAEAERSRPKMKDVVSEIEDSKPSDTTLNDRIKEKTDKLKKERKQTVEKKRQDDAASKEKQAVITEVRTIADDMRLSPKDLTDHVINWIGKNPSECTTEDLYKVVNELNKLKPKHAEQASML